MFKQRDTSQAIILKSNLIILDIFHGFFREVFDTEWSEGDSLIISFANGAAGEEALNKLVQVRNIQVNDQKYSLRNLQLFIQDFQGDIIPNAYSSESRLSKHFRVNGILEAYSLTSSRKGFSKTYNAALDATNWMKANGYHSANVVSVGTHTRRTLACYKKAGRHLSVGMIALPTNWRPSKKKILKEVAGIMVIKLVPRFLLDQKKDIKPRLKKLVETFR